MRSRSVAICLKWACSLKEKETKFFRFDIINSKSSLSLFLFCRPTLGPRVHSLLFLWSYGGRGGGGQGRGSGRFGCLRSNQDVSGRSSGCSRERGGKLVLRGGAVQVGSRVGAKTVSGVRWDLEQGKKNRLEKCIKIIADVLRENKGGSRSYSFAW